MTRLLRVRLRDTVAEFEGRNRLGGTAVIVLRMIGTNPGITQNDLGSALSMTKSAVAHIVADLETEGMIARSKPSTDRRFNLLRLSPAGETEYRRATQEARNHQETLLAPLRPRDRKKLFELLRLLVDHHGREIPGRAAAAAARRGSHPNARGSG
ncbi:MAG: MarR family winged helix-turn-helix transcriptional regulator [Paracoccus sp. (in: a-proteobacteria)]|nr:MarR family winged helix-turn-helix transcriptional regulator [Paracoccus sp. (in: a-proteobacteria)]